MIEDPKPDDPVKILGITIGTFRDACVYALIMSIILFGLTFVIPIHGPRWLLVIYMFASAFCVIRNAMEDTHCKNIDKWPGWK